MKTTDSTPAVSVVIPTRNRATFLERSVESVLRQRGHLVEGTASLEVIVVDDASADETSSVLARYDGAIAAVRNDRNRERGASRNLGASLARGHWIAFLDSDDEWEDHKLTTQLDAVGTAGACLTGSWIIDEDGNLIGLDGGPTQAESLDVDLINPYRAVPSSLLIERDLFLRLGGFPEDRDLQGSEDWLFMAKLLRSGCEPVLLDEPLVRYRVHAGGSTASPERYLRSCLAAVDWLESNGISAPDRAARARAQKYEVAARECALRGELRDAARHLRCALRSLPNEGRLTLVRETARAGLRAAALRLVPGW
jgi:teichuronic acid biosynthesis glycosyltransferase TuaG